MISFLRRLFRHRHKWEASIYNVFGIAVQEYCRRCGKWRHHYLEDIDGIYVGDEPRWREGKHDKLRRERPI